MLQQINYWIEINKNSGNNYHDGKYWTYNSIRAWQEKDFDYLSVDTVKRTFSKLEKAGYLLVGNYNKDPRDKTKWYTINDKKLEELYLELNQRKQEKEREILEQVSKSAMPNALGQNAPMEEGKINQCTSADCTNATEQNLPMQNGNMPQPFPLPSCMNHYQRLLQIIHQRLLHIFLQRIPPTYPSVKENCFIQGTEWRKDVKK